MATRRTRVGALNPNDRVLIHPDNGHYTFLSMRDGNHLKRGYRVCQFVNNQGREFGLALHVNQRFDVTETEFIKAKDLTVGAAVKFYDEQWHWAARMEWAKGRKEVRVYDTRGWSNVFQKDQDIEIDPTLRRTI